VRQLQDALARHVPEQVADPAPGSAREASLPRLVVAYEPVWAIGATQHAPVGHIQEVCAALRTWLTASGLGAASRLMYGGSAGPGLLTELGLAVDGLFVGRRGLDPRGLVEVIAEAAARQHTPAGARPKGNRN
jgi:triosephosphate isomerase